MVHLSFRGLRFSLRAVSTSSIGTAQHSTARRAAVQRRKIAKCEICERGPCGRYRPSSVLRFREGVAEHILEVLVALGAAETERLGVVTHEHCPVPLGAVRSVQTACGAHWITGGAAYEAGLNFHGDLVRREGARASLRFRIVVREFQRRRIPSRECRDLLDP